MSRVAKVMLSELHEEAGITKRCSKESRPTNCRGDLTPNRCRSDNWPFTLPAFRAT
jgi:hypothetical protein